MRAVSQLTVMAAIVSSLVYVPLGAVVALVSYALAVPLSALTTFGGALNNVLLGLLAWWLVLFAGACVYAAFVFPWKGRTLDAPGEK